MEVPRYWRLFPQRYRLEGTVCDRGHINFPPRPRCLECHRENNHLIKSMPESVGLTEQATRMDINKMQI
jgi:uncharacterized OB-fold protein